MDKLLAKADKEVLVEVVRFAQKHGMKGVKGGWKEFLDCHDKKFGSCLSDPVKRSIDVLVAFLETFSEEKDRMLFLKILTHHNDHASIKQFIKEFPDQETLQQSITGYEIRKEVEPHNCLVDSQAAMKLVLVKLEPGFDEPITVARKIVQNSDLRKLLLHKVPVEVPSQTLRTVFPMKYNIEIQDPRIRGQCYSIFVVFKDARVADAAYADIDGKENMVGSASFWFSPIHE